MRNIRNLTTADPHVHLIGAAEPEMLAAAKNPPRHSSFWRRRLPNEWAEWQPILRPSHRSDEPLRWSDFEPGYDRARALITRPEDVAEVMLGAAIKRWGEGSFWMEVQYSPLNYAERFGGLEATMNVFADAARRASSATFGIGLIPTVNWNEDRKNAKLVARLAGQWKDEGVVGYGITGPELDRHEDFKEACRMAREAGLIVVPHSGFNSENPEHVMKCVTMLGARRIGHGIAAVWSPRAIRLLTTNNVVLEVCPASYAYFRDARDLLQHDVRKLLEQGVRVVIGSDDPLLFEHSLSQQYLMLRHFGWTDKELYQLAVNSIEASCASPAAKSRALQRAHEWDRFEGVLVKAGPRPYRPPPDPRRYRYERLARETLENARKRHFTQFVEHQPLRARGFGHLGVSQVVASPRHGSEDAVYFPLTRELVVFFRPLGNERPESVEIMGVYPLRSPEVMNHALEVANETGGLSPVDVLLDRLVDTPGALLDPDATKGLTKAKFKETAGGRDQIRFSAEFMVRTSTANDPHQFIWVSDEEMSDIPANGYELGYRQGAGIAPSQMGRLYLTSWARDAHFEEATKRWNYETTWEYNVVGSCRKEDLAVIEKYQRTWDKSPKKRHPGPSLHDVLEELFPTTPDGRISTNLFGVPPPPPARETPTTHRPRSPSLREREHRELPAFKCKRQDGSALVFAVEEHQVVALRPDGMLIAPGRYHIFTLPEIGSPQRLRILRSRPTVNETVLDEIVVNGLRLYPRVKDDLGMLFELENPDDSSRPIEFWLRHDGRVTINGEPTTRSTLTDLIVRVNGDEPELVPPEAKGAQRPEDRNPLAPPSAGPVPRSQSGEVRQPADSDLTASSAGAAVRSTTPQAAGARPPSPAHQGLPLTSSGSTTISCQATYKTTDNGSLIRLLIIEQPLRLSPDGSAEIGDNKWVYYEPAGGVPRRLTVHNSHVIDDNEVLLLFVTDPQEPSVMKRLELLSPWVNGRDGGIYDGVNLEPAHAADMPIVDGLTGNPIPPTRIRTTPLDFNI